MDAVEEESAPAGADFVPESTHKPKSDVYSAMLVLTFVVVLAGTIIAGREAWEHYDIQFYMFKKEGRPPATSTSDSTTPPAVSDPPAK